MKKYVTLLLAAVVAAAAAPAAGQAAAASGVPANVPRKGLVAFWTADGHAKDSAGKNHGKVGPGGTFTADRDGKAKGAFLFNGKSGFVRIPDSAPLDTDEAFTLAAWINPSAYTDQHGHYSAIFAKWYGSLTHGDYMFCVNPDGRLCLYVRAGPRAYETHYSKSVVPKNTWTHVAATFDAGTIKLYINGHLDVTKVSTKVRRLDPAEYKTDDLYIGAHCSNDSNFTGAIDDVGIWNRALSEEEVAALFRALTRPPPAYLPPKGLVAFWTADGHARDSAGKNHGSIGEGVKFTADRHGKAKGAFGFNGKSGFVTVPDSDALDTDSAFTLSAWIRPKAYKDEKGYGAWIVSKWYSSPVHGDYILFLATDGRVAFTVCESYRPEKSDGMTSRSIVPKDAWTHVAATFERGTMKLYVNGTLEATGASTKVKRTDPAEYQHDDVTIGGLWDDNYNFDGAIDDIGIWKRALSGAEIAAVAGPMAGMHVTRLAHRDRLEMTDSSILRGAIRNEQFTLTTAFGKLTIPAGKIVGILPAPKPKTAATRPASQPAAKGPWVHLLLTYQVVTGRLDEPIIFQTSWSPRLTVPVGSLRQCSYRTVRTKPMKAAATGTTITLRSYQRLMLADKNAAIQFQTDWGKVALPIKSLLRIEPADWQGARHRAILANGSVLTGKLADKLKIKLALGPELTVEPGQVWSVAGTAKPVKPAGATMLLRGGDRLIGRFAGKMLTVKTASGNVKVHAGGITSMQFDANKPTGVTVRTWDNKTIKGTVTDAVVGLEIIPGVLTLKVPPARIANVTQPDASAPPEMLEKIEKLIAQLGAESYLDREKAQKELIAMGKSIVPILTKHLNNPDPEIRQRLGQIIKALGG